MLNYSVAELRTTTNCINMRFPRKVSYIVILHQTTTIEARVIAWLAVSYIVILHQTTTIRTLREIVQ